MLLPYFQDSCFQRNKTILPTGGLEPPIFGLGDRRLIHWATRAANNTVTFNLNVFKGESQFLERGWKERYL